MRNNYLRNISECNSQTVAQRDHFKKGISESYSARTYQSRVPQEDRL